MPQSAQLSIRIDPALKRDAEGVLDDMGLSMSAAVTVFLKKVARERRLPFELTADPFYDPRNLAYLEMVKRDIDEGRARLVERGLIEADE